jgi:hypothetical protein
VTRAGMNVDQLQNLGLILVGFVLVIYLLADRGGGGDGAGGKRSGSGG